MKITLNASHWQRLFRSSSSIRDKSPEKDTSGTLVVLYISKRDFYFRNAHLKFSAEHSYFTFWNIMWTILFGWWMSFFYVLSAGLLTITVIGLPYAKLCWSLASYFFWPFGKFIIRVRVLFTLRIRERICRIREYFLDGNDTRKNNPIYLITLIGLYSGALLICC